MPNPDGSIVFSTEIDNKKAQAELENWKRRFCTGKQGKSSGSEENAVGRTGEFLGRGAG